MDITSNSIFLYLLLYKNMSRYTDFVKSEMQKRPKGVKVTEYIKVVAKKWHSQKKQGGSVLDVVLPLMDWTCYYNTLEDAVNNASKAGLVVAGDLEQTLENMADYSVDKVIDCVNLPKFISRKVLRPLLKADIKSKLRAAKYLSKLGGDAILF